MGGTWVIGAIINVVGSILINLGTVWPCRVPERKVVWRLQVPNRELVQNVMKLGHNKRLAKPAAERPRIRRALALPPLCTASAAADTGASLQDCEGVAAGRSVLCSGQRHELCLIGWAGAIPALLPAGHRGEAPNALCPAGFAAQSILAALGSVQFVSNVLFAWLVLQEKVGMSAHARRRLAGLGKPPALSRMRALTRTCPVSQATRRVCAATGCIVLGCVVLVTFGNHQSTMLTVQEMLGYYERWRPGPAPGLLSLPGPAGAEACVGCSPVYITYLVVMAVVVVSMLLVYRRGSQKLACALAVLQPAWPGDALWRCAASEPAEGRQRVTGDLGV